MFLIITLICLYIAFWDDAIKTAKHDSAAIDRARLENSDTYIDYSGRTKLLKNSHVVEHTTDYKTGDHILYDCTAKKVLKNYSEIERSHMIEEALKNGRTTIWAGSFPKDKGFRRGPFYMDIISRQNYSVIGDFYMDKDGHLVRLQDSSRRAKDSMISVTDSNGRKHEYSVNEYIKRFNIMQDILKRKLDFDYYGHVNYYWGAEDIYSDKRVYVG